MFLNFTFYVSEIIKLMSIRKKYSLKFKRVDNFFLREKERF